MDQGAVVDDDVARGDLEGDAVRQDVAVCVAELVDVDVALPVRTRNGPETAVGAR